MRKFNMFIVIFFTISFLFACGGGGSGGGTSGSNPDDPIVNPDDPNNPTGPQRIKKVIASGGSKSICPLRISKSALKAAEIDLSNPGEYVATYNDIENSADYGKIIRVDKKESGVTVEYYEYTYTIDTDGVTPLTIKVWKDDSDNIIHTTKFFYKSATETISGLPYNYTDVIEYSATNVQESYVRYVYEPGGTRLLNIQQFVGSGDSPFDITIQANYSYYPDTGDLYCIMTTDHSKPTEPMYKYYTKPVIEAEVEVITEVETTTPVSNGTTITGITNNYETDEDGLLVTIEENTGEAVDIPVLEDTADGLVYAGEGDTSEMVTVPEVINYDYVYETGTAEDTNWFNKFYKEFYPFAE